MRRVRKLRYLAGITLAALAAMLVLLASGNSVTEATVYSPISTVSVKDTTSKAVSDVTISQTYPTGGSMVKGFDSLVFLPPEWTVASDADIPDGSIAGIADAFTNLGAFNTFCGLVQVPVSGLPLMEATTGTWSDPSTPGTITSPTVVFEDTDNDGIGEIFDDPATGTLPAGNSVLFIREGVIKYPKYVSDLFPQPRLRYFAYFQVGTANIAINWLIWNPGALIDRGIPADKGYPMMLTLNRSGDPNEPPDPTSPLTDLCASFTASVTMLGTTTPNPLPPNPGAFVTQMTNPEDRPGGYDFRDFSRSQRDADNDGIENSVDTCSQAFNSDASPRTPGAPLPLPLLIAAGPPAVPNTGDPDGWIDLAFILPPFLNAPGSNPFTGLPGGLVADISAPEGIDSACDTGPSSPCGPSPLDDFFAQDCDLDGELNRGDNCPQISNPTQADTDGAVGSFAPDLGPADDDIGDACDLSPGVANGHYHMSVNPGGGTGPICVTAPVDTCGPVDSTGNSPAIGTPDTACLGALLPASASGPVIFPDCAFSSTTVFIGKHGVKLTNVGGAKKIAAGGTKTYTVHVSNFDKNLSQDIVVKVSGTVNCAGGSVDIDALSTVPVETGPGPLQETVTVAADGSAVLSYDVTIGTCDDGSAQSPDYTLTADACHPEDPAPKGFAGGACPGADPHSTEDPNQTDDQPVSKNINENRRGPQ